MNYRRIGKTDIWQVNFCVFGITLNHTTALTSTTAGLFRIILQLVMIPIAIHRLEEPENE